MHISSSTSGLYPVLVPNARNAVVASKVATNAASKTNNAAEQALSAKKAAHDQAADSQATAKRETLLAINSVQARPDVAGNTVDAITRQFESIFNRVSIASGAEKAVSGAVQSSAQRGAAAYADVATQEHRDELITLLGIDVFA